MITKKIKLNQAVSIIFSLNRSEFIVEFIKKDGSLREMKCLKGVKKYLKGGKLSYNPIDKGLLPIYDLDKEAYRMINLNTILSLEYTTLKRKFIIDR